MAPRRATLALACAAAVDVAGALILASACDPLRYARTVWPTQRFLFGESTLDVFLAALVRAALYAALSASAWRRTRREKAALLSPLELPLQLNATPSNPAPPADARRCRRPSAHLISRYVAVGTLFYAVGKALARLIQSGAAEASRGLLPPATTPAPAWFWSALALALLVASAEHHLHARVWHSARAKSAAPKSVASKPTAAADALRAEYLERTTPQTSARRPSQSPRVHIQPATSSRRRNPPQVLRYCLRMMAPDWHLQLFAFGSLALAAAGEVTNARRTAASRP